jgi:hypothetical protein
MLSLIIAIPRGLDYQIEILAIALVWRRRRQFLSRVPDPDDLLADVGERCSKGKVSAPVAGRDGS